MPRATTGLSYLTLGIVILGSLVFTVFVTVPQWGKYRTAKKERAVAVEERQEREEFLTNLEARAEELKKYERDALALSIALPERLAQENMLKTLGNIASRAGATILEVGESEKVVEKTPLAVTGESAGKVEAKKQGVALEKWDTPITVRGTYAQLRAFVHDLENSLLLSDIQSLEVEMKGGREGEVSDILEGDLVIRTYVQSFTE